MNGRARGSKPGRIQAREIELGVNGPLPSTRVARFHSGSEECQQRQRETRLAQFRADDASELGRGRRGHETLTAVGD
jgi:hypothetical protein